MNDSKKKPLKLNDKERLAKTQFRSETDEIKHLEKLQEAKHFSCMKLFVNGNSALNLLWVTSLLFPRHTRWTLLYVNLCLIWFLCGIMYKNTKDPLEIPDSDESARNIAGSEMWISITAPIYA